MHLQRVQKIIQRTCPVECLSLGESKNMILMRYHLYCCGGEGSHTGIAFKIFLSLCHFCEEIKKQLNLEVTDVFQPHKKGSELVDHLSLFLPGSFGH